MPSILPFLFDKSALAS
uniref:Uncharacterized protein n=1 Tax=Romanomermis culicivorax TaxID=13658 RepID=A0A915HJQ9_ROMCU